MKNETNKISFVETEINGWHISHRQVVQPRNAHKEPVVILAGFGDSFSDHNEEVEKLAEDYPVYLVHLPGFGESLEAGAELTYPAYAMMLSSFLDSLGVTGCTLIAHTYAAHIAATFAGEFTTKVSNVILVAPVMKMRDSVQYIMRKNVKSLQEGDVKSFAARQAIHFIPTFTESYSLKRKEIVRDYYLSLLKSNESRAEQFKAHFDRLEQATGNMQHLAGIRDCPTFVISGERDLLTTPEEAFDFAKSCSDATFVLVDDSDHLLALQKGSVLARIYKRALEGKSLKRMRGLKVLESAFLDRKFIRVTNRYAINEKGSVRLEDGKELPVTFENISGFGCKFTVGTELGDDFPDFRSEAQKVTLDFCGLTIDLGIIQSHSNKEFRGVFSFASFEEHEKLHSYLANIT